MKRVVHHLIFWMLYWFIVMYLDFFWLKGNVLNLKNQHYLLLKVALGTLLYVSPLIAFAYYIAGFGLEYIMDNTKRILNRFLIIIVPYILAVLSVIAIMRLFVFPYIFLFKHLPGDKFIDPVRFLSIMVEAAFPAAFLITIRFMDSKLAAAAREQILIKEKLNTELLLLKSQLNPHFLFNTLNNIYALARKKSDQAPEVILKLSELLSFTLYEAGNDTISMEQEIDFLEDYVALQKIRFTDSLSLEFLIQIDDPLQPIAPLILLPLIENAFKHGASEHHSESFIRIHLALQKGHLHFEIANSVEDIAKELDTKKIGLKSSQRQLELLYADYDLVTVSDQGIFKVSLHINLNSYGKF
ncbi:MAG: histidine kinase [Pseudopedobacter saltans]|uniref:Histidine kinase n=1 Tax=Pseudopedobacter saltans TaxID=151895 RepID=A0A2W5F4I3_9SPHI|nr:MAG: histidine kinase [Pseudopedobacter saltans]